MNTKTLNLMGFSVSIESRTDFFVCKAEKVFNRTHEGAHEADFLTINFVVKELAEVESRLRFIAQQYEFNKC